MDIRDLVQALLANEMLVARQWVANAARAGVAWSGIAQPIDLDARELVVAAGIVEMLAERAGQPAPAWTKGIPAATEPILLVRAAIEMPRLRRLCETEGPEPLRRRHVLAPPDFLTAA